MKEVTPEECKKIQLDILINVSKFCEKHDIKYSIAYGTLIGAIRHKGFIPWDDDIDIIMMRDEYERFVATYKDDYYQLFDGLGLANHLHAVVSDMSTRIISQHSGNTNYFYKGGLYVDIFPVDSTSDKMICYKFHKRMIYYIYKWYALSLYIKRKDIVAKILHFMFKPFSHLIGSMVRKLMLVYNHKDTGTVSNYSLWYLNFPPFPKYFMDTYEYVEFEGHQFKAIKEYDKFLRGIYGDYMQLPPASERIPRHNYKTYWRD